MFRKIKKLGSLLRRNLYRRALTQGVAAAVEHERILTTLKFSTVVDIGANKGQFALVARNCNPNAKIYSYEPLPGPASSYRAVFEHDSLASLISEAIAPLEDEYTIHISARDDSSSLLPISKRQADIFPGTEEVGTSNISAAPLSKYLSGSDIVTPALLKLDVQGYELEALRGCEDLLSKFDCVYCECSFVELYSGQKLVTDVIDWLLAREFYINGIYNPSYDRHGKAVQADFLFERKKYRG